MTSLPTLRTARLVLRPFVATDAPVVQRLAAAPEIAATTLNIPHPYPDGAAAAWIAGHAEHVARGTAHVFAVESPQDGVVGAIELRLAAAHLHAELGYWIGVPWWGRGFATEAARAVVRHAFETLGLKRVHAHHMAENVASGAVLQKAGLHREGRLRAHVRRGGRFHDVELYGLTDDEFGHGAAERAAVDFRGTTPVLPVRDLAAALRWFEERLRWRRVFAFPELGYAGFERAGATLHLQQVAEGNALEPPARVRFRVRGIEALHDECAAAGALAEGDAGELARKPWGPREFEARDADGNELVFSEESRT